MYILRITFKSITSIKFIQKFLFFLKNNKNKIFKNILIRGLIKIKNKNKIFTILKSPHVNKKSREHFIYKTYTQKIDIKFFNFYLLLNFLIIIKKLFSQNNIIKIKIIKN